MTVNSPTSSIEEAAQRLKKGMLVAFPTETVYGLGADATNPAAIALIYEAKGRPKNHPLILHIAEPAQIKNWVDTLAAPAKRLIEKLMPGPLTLVLQKATHVLNDITAGQDSVAIRCPAHPMAQSLLKSFGGAVVAPSANRFGQISPSHHDHVKEAFKNSPIPVMILEAGLTSVGIESTIVDARSEDRLIILRPGTLSREHLATIAKVPVFLKSEMTAQNNPKVSGDLLAHYAPQTRLCLLSRSDLLSELKKNSEKKRIFIIQHSLPENECPQTKIVKTHIEQWSYQPAEINQQMQTNKILISQMPNQFESYAHWLYAQLHLADQIKADVIYIENPTDQVDNTEDWLGVMDRLQKAVNGSGKNHVENR